MLWICYITHKTTLSYSATKHIWLKFVRLRLIWTLHGDCSLNRKHKPFFIENKNQQFRSLLVSFHHHSSHCSEKYSLKKPFLAEAVQFSYTICKSCLKLQFLHSLYIFATFFAQFCPPETDATNDVEHVRLMRAAENQHCTFLILSVLKKATRRYFTFSVEQPTRKACSVCSYITESEDLHSKYSM